MFARLTIVEGSPDKADAGIDAFKSQLMPVAKAVDGYKGALLLVDRASGKAVGMTLWDSEDARRRGAEAVTEARQKTLTTMGAGAPEPQEFEVAVADL